jgi:hypothetical protein
MVASSSKVRGAVRLAAILALLCGGASAALPSTTEAAPIGVLSFDVFLPSNPPDDPGTNAFFIANLTGGEALPGAFDVTTALTLQGSVLTLRFADDSSTAVTLGDIGPGLFDAGTPPFVLQFSDAVSFRSARLTATLSDTTLAMSDGTVLVAASSAVDVALFGAEPSSLLAGGDFVVIDVPAAPIDAAIPEPSTLLLLGSGIAALAGRAARRTFRRADR